MDIHLHIDRLILDGVPLGPGQGARVQAAVEAELARLLASGHAAEAWSSGVTLPVVRAGAIRLAAGNDPAQLGGQIARAVYGGIAPQGRMPE